MKKYLLIILVIFANTFPLFSAEYILNLSPEQWPIQQKGYYISTIHDARPDESLGEVMENGKVISAAFPHSISADLSDYIFSSLSYDSTTIPIILEIQKFKLTVKGTPAKHQVTLDFAIRFYREIEGEQYELFKLNGQPGMSVQGNYKGVPEKIIAGSLQQAMKSFDDWIKQNMSIPPMAQSAEILFVPETKLSSDKGDTLIWDNNYKLVWTDFKGKPPGSDFSAESNCMFNYKARPEVKDGKMILSIIFNACFVKGSSWVKEDKKQDSLLIHEQYHFNICEKHARILKTKLSNLVLSPMKFEKQIKTLFDEQWQLYIQEQNDYDNQTEHGLIKEKQDEWIKEVDGFLGE